MNKKDLSDPRRLRHRLDQRIKERDEAWLDKFETEAATVSLPKGEKDKAQAAASARWAECDRKVKALSDLLEQED